MELNNGEIFTRGHRSTSPLEKLNVWQNSSAVFFIHAPFGVNSLQFVLGGDAIDASYDVKKNCWRVYINPIYLSAHGEFCYTIQAVDEFGNQNILGSGTLAVKEAPVKEETGGGQAILPAGASAYNPQTGKYHTLLATQDPETGVIVVTVNQIGEDK